MRKFLKDLLFNWAARMIFGFIGGGHAGYWWIMPLLLSTHNPDSTNYYEHDELASLAEYIACAIIGPVIGATIGAIVGALVMVLAVAIVNRTTSES